MLREEDLVDEDAPLTDEDDLLEDELLVAEEPELLVEEEFLDEDDVEFPEEELLDEDLVWDEVVLPLVVEERLSCEYESTGAAIMASATADASAMFRMFLMMIRC